MSEYSFVEKPLLNQLGTQDWKVIEQSGGIPKDPTISLRTSFREVLLKDEFKKAVAKLNILDDNKPWLTDAQLDQLFEDFSGFGTGNLLEANETFLQRLYKWQVDQNEVTGEQDPVVNIIDFDNWQANSFIAINQFRIDTPGGLKEFIIPDVVLFVNGLPLVVIECKDVNSFTSDAMSEGVKQLRRYADLREETIEAGLKEGEQKLFWTNQLMVSTYGDDCKFGTITSSEEYYFHWKTIHPDTTPYADNTIKNHRPQERLVQGMLHPERLLDITRSFTLFMDAGSARIKVICRYQQYRAVEKILTKMRSGNTGLDRSGVVWHTQGSGKSLTMVFLVRRLRRDPVLKEYKVLMVNDRKDLDKQLGETAALTGETVYRINSAAEVKEKLAGAESTLNMVMIHKFREGDDSNTPDYVASAIDAANDSDTTDKVADVDSPPYSVEHKVFEKFDEVNTSEKILVLIDEAHRTQSGGKEDASLSDNLFDAFPNATRLAFTGTPLIADHHTDPTWKRFGNNPNQPYIDTYKLQDAVEDGATLQILYEGRTADTAIYDKHGFDTKFEDLFKHRSEAELAAIRQKYGATGDILEAEDRIQEIADDLVKHYFANILPSGFKAQVVCSSKQAAIHYQTYLRKALAKWVAAEQAKPEPEQDQQLLALADLIKVAVVISSDGTNEKAVFVAARKEAREMSAVENFKKKFNSDKPETGVAFLIVCDMLLTGFDAPIEQVMYIDKKLKEHNLLQTIARVNRTYANKTVGYVVDYIGLTENLKDALSLYSGKDQQDIMESFKSIESEVPVLESRYRRLIQLFEEKGVKQIEALVKQALATDAERYETTEAAVRILEDIKTRDSFNVYLKKFMQSMDVILPNRLASPFKIPMYQLCHIQAKARERYKDDSINISGAGEKVRKLVNEHLISLGINPKVPPVELFSDKFIQQVTVAKDPRAAASEMEHAIRKHCKVNEGDDPVMYRNFSEKLEEVVKKYNENWEQMVLALTELRDEIDKGRGPEKDSKGPFYDLIVDIAFDDACPNDLEAKVQTTVDDVLEVLAADIRSLNFWERPAQVSELEGKIEEVFILSGVGEFSDKQDLLVTEVMALAKRREQSILKTADDENEVEV
ncbi:type I restriction endonuclease [Dasania sp. GY-MA-18]|uniref:type I site-specific deoxyribonuclease n=1 Tax=Dasania phycosphaerae TaxID=2950436 RepID=A0A9J6RMT7_9GAMM|nr:MULTISPECIES: type I restriction endonuclease [Dasania]MCR8923201.1 type I restriction endonuclease [Dasania sp. GY-MA-18]MCZ0865633.1 type I restriction endonuclease [Dasania phycosphaerae]MCZ0869358.1 type I restriction endonuclease [Dasania phycosphaerae]